MPINAWPWAIVLCRFSNVPNEPQPVRYYEDLFTRYGIGSVCDYFRTITCGTLDLSGSRVFGGLDVGHSTVDYATDAQHIVARSTAVQWAAMPPPLRALI